MVRPAPKNIDLRKARAAVEVGAISKLLVARFSLSSRFQAKKC
jgi:hypothetical protein